MKRFFISIILILLLPTPGYSEQMIRAVVDSTEITMEEYVNLTIIINSENGEVDISPIKHFHVISRDRSSSIKILNSNMTKKLRFSYTLLPLSQGYLKIPSLNAKIGNKTYKTKEIKINVIPESKKNNNTRDIFVKASVNIKNSYVGQQIIYTFQLFYSVNFVNLKLQNPDFKGFTVKEIAGNKKYSTNISDKEYNVTEVAYILTPVKSGKQTISPSILHCDIFSKKMKKFSSPFDSFFNNDPFFNNSFVRSELINKVFKTNSISINVKPLPAYNGDVKFSGLIGNFDIISHIENTNLIIGDSATLSITISGTGNIMDTSEPDIKLPNSFKMYKDNPETKIVVGDRGFKGEKVFRTAIVPVKKGCFIIKPIILNYFDISKNKYVIKSTNPISINVKQSKEEEKFDVVAETNNDNKNILLKKKVEFTGQDILSVKEDQDAIKNQITISSISYLFSLLFSVFLFILFIIFVKFTNQSESTSVMLDKKFKHLIKKAESSQHKKEEFLTYLYKAFISAIYAKSGTYSESLTSKEIENILISKNNSKEIIKIAGELFIRIEKLKYSDSQLESKDKQELLAEIKYIARNFKS